MRQSCRRIELICLPEFCPRRSALKSWDKSLGSVAQNITDPGEKMTSPKSVLHESSTIASVA